MATLSSYEALDFYDKRLDLTGNDFVLGYSKEFWVGPLEFAQSRPTIKTITAEAAALADAETISVSSDIDVRLYRGDVLQFPACLAVIAETVEITATATTVNVLPLEAGIADAATAITYGLFPVWSLQDGGDLELSGTEAMTRNKIQGLYSAKRVVEREGSINVTGALYTQDPGALFLEKTSEGSKNIYYEMRWAPYQTYVGDDGVTISKGSGPGARVGVATVQAFNITSVRSEFAQVNGTLTIASRPVPYIPLVA